MKPVAIIFDPKKGRSFRPGRCQIITVMLPGLEMSYLNALITAEMVNYDKIKTKEK